MAPISLGLGSDQLGRSFEMLIRRASDIPSSEITPETLYHNRREFMKTASALLATAAFSTILPGCATAAGPEPQTKAKLGPFDTNEKPSSYEDITTYNNYYEFGTDKADPAKNAKNFKPKPWTVSVEGMVKKPTAYALDDLIKGLTIEDRIYRHRCVE